MSQATESPRFTQALPADVDSSARAFPGRVRGQRLEVTTADLTMYSAITGRSTSQEERERALTWSEADPMHEQINGAVEGSSSSALQSSRSSAGSTAVVAVGAMKRWHPAALSERVRDIWLNGITLRVNRPQIAQWVRRLSLALRQGRRRVGQQGR